MTFHTQPIPHHLASAFSSLQSVGEAHMVRLLKDALPARRCLALSLLGAGAGAVAVRAAQHLDFDMVALAEPWGAPTPWVGELLGTNLVCLRAL
jgi:hypothetical protein